MSELVNYKRSSDNVSETAEIYAKSTRTTLCTISLLKLFSKELSADPSHPGSIAMAKMQDIPEISIIESRPVVNKKGGK